MKRSLMSRTMTAFLTAAVLATSVSVPSYFSTTTAVEAAVKKSVSINYSKLTIKKGKTKTLKAKVSGTDAKVVWTSSKPETVSVTSKGVVKGLKKGSAVITATISGTKVKDTVKVTVGTPVKSVSVPDEAVTLTEGDIFDIQYSVEPSSASNKNVKFTSANESVAAVTSDGELTALAPGKADVTVSSTDGSGKKAVVEITVVAEQKEESAPQPEVKPAEPEKQPEVEPAEPAKQPEVKPAEPAKTDDTKKAEEEKTVPGPSNNLLADYYTYYFPYYTDYEYPYYPYYYYNYNGNYYYPYNGYYNINGYDEYYKEYGKYPASYYDFYKDQGHYPNSYAEYERVYHTLPADYYEYKNKTGHVPADYYANPYYYNYSDYAAAVKAKYGMTPEEYYKKYSTYPDVYPYYYPYYYNGYYYGNYTDFVKKYGMTPAEYYVNFGSLPSDWRSLVH